MPEGGSEWQESSDPHRAETPQQQVQRRLRRARPDVMAGAGQQARGLDPAVDATPYQIVPTGFASLPPPGPAMPVTETAASAPSRSTAPRAIASATGSLTAPCSATSAGSTPSTPGLELVGVGDDAAHVDVRAARDLRQPRPDQAAGA